MLQQQMLLTQSMVDFMARSAQGSSVPPMPGAQVPSGSSGSGEWKTWTSRARELSGFKGWMERFASWLCLIHDSYAAELKEALVLPYPVEVIDADQAIRRGICSVALWCNNSATALASSHGIPRPYENDGDLDKVHGIAENKGQGKGNVYDKECFNCGKKGHLAKDCRNLPKCKHCGKSGHMAKDCWEKDPSKRPKMDEYDHELKLDDHDNVEAWLEEEKDDVAVDGMPNELWADWQLQSNLQSQELGLIDLLIDLLTRSSWTGFVLWVSWWKAMLIS
eukprot:s4440_g3.t1